MDDEGSQIIEDMSELQKYIVLLINADNNSPIKGDSWFQKELFLIANNIPSINEEASFQSDMYGPWSENAKEQLEDLEMDDVISKSNRKMWLSPLGSEIADRLNHSVPKENLEMVLEFKELLNDLGDEELLTFIYFSYPAFTEESLVLDKIQNNRVSNAIKLYEKGKISLEKASEISDIPLEELVRGI